MEVEKVREIVRTQFASELTYKVGELNLIEERIQLAKFMLHRLRLGILAQHYSVAALCPPEDFSAENIGAQGSWESFEKAFLQSEAFGESEEAAPPSCSSQSCTNACSRDPSDSDSGEDSAGEELDAKSGDETESGEPLGGAPTTTSGNTLASRFYTKKRLIVGNTSQFIDPKVRGGDGSTHKWMMYVRGPSGEADISGFVKSVTFFLHPSYHPNDIVKVSRPPFHLTRLGWGEFPVRVQLEFTDGRNKPVDIIHNLLLDRTHTGLQTLGAETVVELDIVSVSSKPVAVAANTRVLPALLPPLPPPPPPPPPPLQSLQPPSPTLFPVTQEVSYTTANGVGFQIKQESPPVATEMEGPPNQPPSVQTVTLPCTLPALKVLLDHDYCFPVVVTRSVELVPPTSEFSSCPLQGGGQQTGTLDRHLHHIVQGLPLYGRPLDDLPMMATSLEQFKAWSVGRRRALEWMRAVAMCRQLGKRVGVVSPTTKQVVEWCRSHGYTPLDPAFKDSPGFCKLCGWQLTSSVDPLDPEPGVDDHHHHHQACRERLSLEDGSTRLSTLSSPFELFKAFKWPECRKNREDPTATAVLDVESVGGQVAGSSPSDHLPKFRVPQTPELKWVQQTAGSIGISIYPAVIEKMYAHVVEHMIFMACSRFVKVILTEAVNETAYTGGGASSKEHLLLPVHLYNALQNLELCDFLTNKHIGLPPPSS